MKIVEATLWPLQIPFAESFAHSAQSRAASDSIVVRLKAADGTVGYGEVVARPYVTGETVSGCLEFISEVLWPAIAAADYSLPPAIGSLEAENLDWLETIAATLPAGNLPPGTGTIAWTAACAGLELALIDCLLKQQQRSLASLLPPKRTTVTYSGAITTGSLETAIKRAKTYQLFGLTQMKVKLLGDLQADCDRIAAIREAVGSKVTLRMDGNGAYDLDGAIALCRSLDSLKIDAAEQLLPRGDLSAWTALTAASPIAIAVDESLVTVSDARELIAANACHCFNLRIAKCGGLVRSLEMVRIACTAGISLHLGCHVGETAILSAAGRHLAAYLDGLVFVEGSYSTLLLAEDISQESLHFGHGGRANLLRRPGLGIAVQDAVLERYATRRIDLEGQS